MFSPGQDDSVWQWRHVAWAQKPDAAESSQGRALAAQKAGSREVGAGGRFSELLVRCQHNTGVLWERKPGTGLRGRGGSRRRDLEPEPESESWTYCWATRQPCSKFPAPLWRRTKPARLSLSCRGRNRTTHTVGEALHSRGGDGYSGLVSWRCPSGPRWRKMEDTLPGWVWVRRERMWTQGHGSSTGEEHGLNPKAVVEAPRKRQQKGPQWPAEKGMESQGGGRWNPVLKQWICGKIGPSNKEVRKYFREKAWCF